MSLTTIFLTGALILIVIYAIIIAAVYIYGKSSGKDPKSTIIGLIVVLVIFLLCLLYIYSNNETN
jgi:hypothetical protein